MERLHKIGCYLARPQFFFYALIWLIVILLVGTISQKYIGLYEAQRIYFSSLFFWLGPLPLPAGYTVLAFMFINLTCKLVFASPWRWNRAGTIISHSGALLLLLGGLLTAVNSQEGSMFIYEHDRSNQVADYHLRELVVSEETSEGEKRIAVFPWSALKAEEVFQVPGTPLRVEIIKYCRNCNIFQRKPDPSISARYSNFKSRAKDLDFEAMTLDPKDENNRSGALFLISGAGEGQDGVYLSFDFIPVSPTVTIGDKTYHIAVRKKITELPFSIELVDFQKQMHPGTEMARSYKSDVILRDGDMQWPSVIQMNEPLRYKGYTFYQSSFVEEDGREATVLAVVKNAGRMFPYISSIIMCIGLLIHLCIQIPRLIKGRT